MYQNPDYAPVNIRLCIHAGDINRRYPFQPDRLPDAAGGSVKHPAAFELLLSAGVIRGIGQIPDAHHELIGLIGLWVQHVRDVKRERQIATRMGTDLPAVDIDRADLIHRAEVQEKPAVFSRVACRPRYRSQFVCCSMEKLAVFRHGSCCL